MHLLDRHAVTRLRARLGHDRLWLRTSAPRPAQADSTSADRRATSSGRDAVLGHHRHPGCAPAPAWPGGRSWERRAAAAREARHLVVAAASGPVPRDPRHVLDVEGPPRATRISARTTTRSACRPSRARWPRPRPACRAPPGSVHQRHGDLWLRTTPTALLRRMILVAPADRSYGWRRNRTMRRERRTAKRRRLGQPSVTAASLPDAEGCRSTVHRPARHSGRPPEPRAQEIHPDRTPGADASCTVPPSELCLPRCRTLAPAGRADGSRRKESIEGDLEPSTRRILGRHLSECFSTSSIGIACVPTVAGQLSIRTTHARRRCSGSPFASGKQPDSQRNAGP